MKIDASGGAAQMLVPWDLTITVQGKDHVTHRPSVADMCALQRLGALSEEEGLKLVAGLFEDPGPDVAAWAMDEVTFVIAAYLAYFNQRAEKNSRAVSDSVSRIVSATASA